MSPSVDESTAGSPEKEPPKVIDVTRIKDRKCLLCQHDLTDLIERSQKQKMLFPDKCPHCQAIFLTTRMTKTVWACGNCNTKLVEADPEKEVYCRHCGAVLIYPPELCQPSQPRG